MRGTDGDGEEREAGSRNPERGEKLFHQWIRFSMDVV
jgi:hypothetical protein